MHEAGRRRASANRQLPTKSATGASTPASASLKSPKPTGVVERWNRTLKEQAIYGRVFHNLAELRAAVAAFVERYNQCWRL